MYADLKLLAEKLQQSENTIQQNQKQAHESIQKLKYEFNQANIDANEKHQ